MKRNATIFLLGFGVIAAHLLLAKMLWGFPWDGAVVGISLGSVVGSAIGYFHVWRRRRRYAMGDLEIVGRFREPVPERGCVSRSEISRSVLKRSGPLPRKLSGVPLGPAHSRAPAGSGDCGACPACGERRLYHRPQSVMFIPSRMAQKRLKKTQNNPRGQLPKLRF